MAIVTYFQLNKCDSKQFYAATVTLAGLSPTIEEETAQESGKHFSIKTGTFMQSSKIGYQNWLYAFYLFATNLKSVSSMKLHRELGITQKSAWHMAHRYSPRLELGPGAEILGSGRGG